MNHSDEDRKWEPASGDEIQYTARWRKFELGEALVVFAIASCAYRTGGWQLRMTATGPESFIFEQLPPGLAPDILTYHVTGGVTGLLDDIPDSVTIEDAFGKHDVPVTEWEA